jgi:hypothetical protein
MMIYFPQVAIMNIKLNKWNVSFIRAIDMKMSLSTMGHTAPLCGGWSDNGGQTISNVVNHSLTAMLGIQLICSTVFICGIIDKNYTCHAMFLAIIGIQQL